MRSLPRRFAQEPPQTAIPIAFLKGLAIGQSLTRPHCKPGGKTLAGSFAA